MIYKVVHLVTQIHGGAGNAVMQLHRALLAEGINSTVLTLDKKQDITDTSIVQYNIQQRNNISSFLNKKIRSLKFRLRIGEEKWYRLAYETKQKYACFYTNPTSSLRVENHPIIQKADIIHLHWIENFINYPTFFKSIHKPIVWTFHDINCGMGGFHFQIEKDMYNEQYQTLEKHFLKIKHESYNRCTNLSCVALSSEMAQYIKKIPYLTDKRLYNIPNISNTQQFYPIDKKKARDILNIPQDKIILLFISDYPNHPSKGLQFLLKASDILDNPRINICIAGVSLDPIIQDRQDVIYLGHLTDTSQMRAAYSAADLLVFPSLQEAFSLTTLEATACGLPIVAFPCSGVKDLLSYENGIICNTFSSESLVEGIQSALSRKYNSSTIRSIATNRFSMETIAKQYTKVYQKALNCP